MRHRPFLLFFSALLFLYFPLEWAYRYYVYQVFSWTEAILFVLLPLVLIVGLIKVNRAGWYALIALTALWGFQDLSVYYRNHGTDWSLLSHLSIFVVTLIYFINPRVRHLYFDPKLRWWRTKRRYETYLPLVTRRLGDIAKRQGERSGDTGECLWEYPIMRNLSEGGCFLETPQGYSGAQSLSIHILLPEPLSLSVIQVEGEVRWISQSPTRPGIGIQFKNLGRSQVRAIAEFLKKG